MKKLSKELQARRSQIVQEIRDASDDLEREIEKYNETMNLAFGDVEGKAQLVNDAINKAKILVQEVAEEIGKYIDARSPAWRDSIQGERYLDFLNAWTPSIDDVDIPLPEALDPDDTGEQAAVELEGLPNEIDKNIA